jgi:hypothetical protein
MGEELELKDELHDDELLDSMLIKRLSIYTIDELATAVDIISKIDNSDNTYGLRKNIEDVISFMGWYD